MSAGNNDYYANKVVTSPIFPSEPWNEWPAAPASEKESTAAPLQAQTWAKRQTRHTYSAAGLAGPFIDCLQPGWLTPRRQQNAPEATVDCLRMSSFSFLFFSPLLCLPSLCITSASWGLSLSGPRQWPVLRLILSIKGATDSDLVWRLLPKFVNFLSKVHSNYVGNCISSVKICNTDIRTHTFYSRFF